jgi:multidrug efflux pump subunit AcrA (membrane-fusion protein)
MAEIDPRPYQAQLDPATANRDRDQAQLLNARANLNRFVPGTVASINCSSAALMRCSQPMCED